MNPWITVACLIAGLALLDSAVTLLIAAPILMLVPVAVTAWAVTR